MKTISIGVALLAVSFFFGCDNKTTSGTKTQTTTTTPSGQTTMTTEKVTEITPDSETTTTTQTIETKGDNRPESNP